MKISFPSSILKLLPTYGNELPQFEFRLNNLKIANQDLKLNHKLLVLNKSTTVEATMSNDSFDFQFIIPNLVRELKDQHEQNNRAAFFNFELLKYEFNYTQMPPLTMNSHWKSNSIDRTIELNLVYLKNFRKNLLQVNFMIIMPMKMEDDNSNVYKITPSKYEPNALVQETKDGKIQILWRFPSINSNGELKIKFTIANESSPSDSPIDIKILEKFYQQVYAKFNMDSDTLSELKFNILSTNYRLSLLKETITSGKYFATYEDTSLQQQHQQQQMMNKDVSSTSMSLTSTSMSTDQNIIKQNIIVNQIDSKVSESLLI
jgi:hypothetical protein